MNADDLPEELSAHIARRERLAVLCSLDRATLRLVLRPSPPPAPAAPSGHGGLGNVFAVTQFLPGAVGRWSRRLARGGNVLRALL